MKIQKLDLQDVYSKIDFVSISAMAGKIDELVDAVNNQQIQLNEHDQEIDDCAATISKMEKVETRTENLKELAKKAEKECRFNPLQADREVYNALTHPENVQDKFAEQRKWIGKLCRFWDFVYDHYYFDTLKGITDKGLFIGHNGSWEHCEPVKPDDDIIYKGE